MNLPVYIDASVLINLGAGTNEDRILAGRFDETLPWTPRGDASIPRSFKFDQLSAESITFAVWGIAAYTTERHLTALGTLSDTGLVTPTF